MTSLYRDLCYKLQKDPRLTKRGGPRQDLGLLLFNAREALFDLWDAADRSIRLRDAAALDDLGQAVDRLRPLFGEQSEAKP